jgi:hypothetical protein
MTFRLKVIQRGEMSVVKVDGTLTAEGCTEFLGTVHGCGYPLRLDLTDLRCADEEVLRVLRSLEEDGAEIVGASHYIAMLLGISTDNPESEPLPAASGAGEKGMQGDG